VREYIAGTRQRDFSSKRFISFHQQLGIEISRLMTGCLFLQKARKSQRTSHIGAREASILATCWQQKRKRMDTEMPVGAVSRGCGRSPLGTTRTARRLTAKLGKP
jgi:hypothetical protein